MAQLFAIWSLLVVTFMIVYGVGGTPTGAQSSTSLPSVTVSTIPQPVFRGVITDIKPHPDQTSLLILDSTALWRVNPSNGTKTNVAGSPDFPGYQEGSGEVARFYSPSSMAVVHPDKVIVSDTENSCLRRVMLSTRATVTEAGICQHEGSADGNVSQAEFWKPAGVIMVGNLLFVADKYNHAVRMIKDNQVTTITSAEKPIKSPQYFTAVAGKVYLTTHYGVMKLDVSSLELQLLVGSERQSGFTGGSLLDARFQEASGLAALSSDILLVADQFNNAIRLIDLRTQRVSTICSGRSGRIDGGADVCAMNDPTSLVVWDQEIFIGEFHYMRKISEQSIKDSVQCPCLNLALWTPKGSSLAETSLGGKLVKFPIGSQSHIFRLWNGVECTVAVNVTVGPSLTCPSNRTVQIQEGKTTVLVSWTSPTWSEVVGSKEVTCARCPPTTQEFTVGNHLVEYVYQHNADVSLTISCSFVVKVEAKPATTLQVSCPTEMSILMINKGDSNTTFSMDTVSGKLKATLPKGRYQFEIPLKPEVVCSHEVLVFDKYPSRRIVGLRAKYKVTCGKMDKLSYNIIDGQLLIYRQSLAHTCPRCNLTKTLSLPFLSCTSNVLSVIWPTEIELQNATIPSPLRSRLQEDLKLIQAANLNGGFLQITVISSNPPIVSPESDADGLYLTPVMMSECPLPYKMIYSEPTDTCQLLK